MPGRNEGLNSNPSDQRYQTLGLRFVAALIDTVVILPFFGLLLLFDEAGLASLVVSSILLVCSVTYYVIAHGLYGKTLGKKAMGVVVVSNGDEVKISLGQSARREAPMIVLVVCVVLAEVVVFALSNTRFVGGFLLLRAILDTLIRVWQFADCITALCTKKHRTLHDLIGGTVVVRGLR